MLQLTFKGWNLQRIVVQYIHLCTINTPVLKIAAGHWSLSDQFQHLADQNPFWLAKFTVHFQWDGNQ